MKSRIEVSQVLMTFNAREGVLNRTCQADSPVISEYTNLKKLLVEGRGKKYPTRQCKVCAAHKKQCETRNICKFCIVPFHKGP